MDSNPLDQWLIRTAENRITGPYTRQQIRELIEKGQLKLNDEVCHANRYWFFLHEHSEIRGQLGMELPKELYGGAEESTQTETDTEIEPTDPGLELEGTRVAAMGTAGGLKGVVRQKEPDVPELAEPLEEIGENTAVMSNRAFRDFRQNKKPESHSTTPVLEPAPSPSAPPATAPSLASAPAPAPPIRERRTGVEKSRLLQYFTYFLMIGAVALVIIVIKLLQQQPGG